MSAENVDTVRTLYERWSEGDFETTLAVVDPHFLLVMRPEFPDSGTYLGVERLMEYTRGFLEPWDRITIDAEEITDVDGSVVAAVLQRGAGVGSGAETEFRYFQVWSFRGDRAIRLENFRERSEAMRAAGLSE